MRIDLTKTVVDSLACPPKKRDILVFDLKLTGFAVRVTDAGSKIFLVQYSRNGRTRRLTIGKYGILTVAEARRKAMAAIGEIQAGADPLAAREQEQAAAAAALELKGREEAARREADRFTVGVLLDTWQAVKLKHRSVAYRREAPAGVRRLLGAELVASPAASLTTGAVQLIVDREIARAPVQAVDGRAYARAAWNWALKRGLVADNPFTGVVIEHRVSSRDRVLTDVELAHVWRVTETKPYPFGPLIRLLVLTLQRRSEVSGMCWSELSGDGKTWTIPAARSKNRKAHVVHLAEPARQILKELRERRDAKEAKNSKGVGTLPEIDLIFTTTGQTAVSGIEKARRWLDDDDHDDKSERRSLDTAPAQPTPRPQRKGLKRSPDDWRLHDFRRTGVSKMAELGIPPHVADRILNHVSGSIQGVAAVYQRFEFLPERQRALDVWAAHVLSIDENSQPDTNILQLKKRR